MPVQRDARPLQKILFSTVVGPYGVDSESTRFKNPMSLLSNQVTRGQTYYTVQMAARAFAFDLFGVNLDADVAVLNFPQPAQLAAVLSSEPWDRIGVSSILPNFESLVETWRCIRRVKPGLAIDVGGHIANDEEVIRELVQRIRALDPTETFNIWKPGFEHARVPDSPTSVSSWLVREGLHGAGITFVKRDGLDYYGSLPGLGLKDRGWIHAPLVDASVGKRVMGIPLPSGAAGLLIPDVGCPMKCNFCSTSHKFGGRFVRYLSTAADILAVANAHADQGKAEMFVMSENFSLDTRRALELLRLMEEQRRPHKFSVFSSANGLIKLGVENIVKLGYSFIWIGLEESSGTAFRKSHEIDLRELVMGLQAHGVEVLGSTILGFEHHKEHDLDREVAHAISFGCVYNQFMLYMPVPGTELHAQMKREGKLRLNFPYPDMHGQVRQNWHHAHLSDEVLERRLDLAFEQDFRELGPSLYRMMQVHWNGYVKTASWEHELVQMRRAWMKRMFVAYIPFLSAMERDLVRTGHAVAGRVRALRKSLIEEVGLRGRLAGWVGGPLASAALQIEKLRHARVQRTKRAEQPRCTLTHYGVFSKKRRRGVPKAEPGRAAVPIPRRVGVEQEALYAVESPACV